MDNPPPLHTPPAAGPLTKNPMKFFTVAQKKTLLWLLLLLPAGGKAENCRSGSLRPLGVSLHRDPSARRGILKGGFIGKIYAKPRLLALSTFAEKLPTNGATKMMLPENRPDNSGPTPTWRSSCISVPGLSHASNRMAVGNNTRVVISDSTYIIAASSRRVVCPSLVDISDSGKDTISRYTRNDFALCTLAKWISRDIEWTGTVEFSRAKYCNQV